MHPTARRTDIIVQTLGTEVLAYDQRHDAAHSLNASAALVYEHADGTRSIDALAALLGDSLGVPHDRALVEVALLELQEAKLLETTIVGARGVSRRDVVRRLGLAAAAMPLVASVVAPTPLMAQSRRSPRSHSKPSYSKPSWPSHSKPSKPSKPSKHSKKSKPGGIGHKELQKWWARWH